MSERYRVPDPKCNHARRGIVRAGDPHGAYAATNVCDRPECIEDAKAWAEAEVRLPAEHVPDRARKPTPEPDPEPLLFPEWEAAQ